MAVFRAERSKGYTVMSNHRLRNKELFLKAKGLLSQMLLLPEDWDSPLAGLSFINREKIDAIRKALRNRNAPGISSVQNSLIYRAFRVLFFCTFIYLFCAIHSRQLPLVRLTALCSGYRKHTGKQRLYLTGRREHIQRSRCLCPYRG